MADLENELDALTSETGFPGVIRIDQSDRTLLVKTHGFAHRGFEIPNTLDTRFGIASGAKGFTALTVVSLIEEGVLELSTLARSVLGDDLPSIGDSVTVEHLLSHRSGIGDYLDEEAGYEVADYMMPVPVQQLVTTEDYLEVLDGHESKFAPGERFAYCNAGYVLLALIAERTSGLPFHELVEQRVCQRAGLVDTAFPRSDELPSRSAVGYVEVDGTWRSNVFHLPVRGSGDGGIYTTIADMSSFWQAFLEGRIVSPDWVSELVRPRSEAPRHSKRYGLGFWLRSSADTILLEGHDAGVSFRSLHDPGTRMTITVISNTSEGAWRIARYLEDELCAEGRSA
ncbi:MAG: beta-lactamase family protein [Actinobacteria bacterium]|nr:beta-lactamase family protein [Actinomycetota bacterium]